MIPKYYTFVLYIQDGDKNGACPVTVIATSEANAFRNLRIGLKVAPWRESIVSASVNQCSWFKHLLIFFMPHDYTHTCRKGWKRINVHIIRGDYE